ncbi:SDR family NAD(P)-dependent oxidoreductase [Jatrophihabitans fulvus]
MPLTPTRAMITGASAGIGEAFARALAARRCDLVLVARREDRLRALAEELQRAHGVDCATVALDLGVDRAGRRLRELVDGEVDLVVNNAGFGTQGPFIDTDGDALAQQIAVDLRAVVDVCHAFLPEMVARRRGAVINVSSTTAFQPVPTMAVYAAAKAFVVSFTESLWQELKPHGVIAFTLAPGPTRTEFFDVVGDTAATIGGRQRMQTAEQVAATGLRTLARRHPPSSVVSGLDNAVTARLAKFVPKRVLLPAVANVLRPIKSA